METKEELFKQLQRAKAENEKLKEKINTYVCSANCHNYIKADKYKTALEEIRDSFNTYAKTEDFVIDQTFNEFFENIFLKINEVLE